MAPPARTGKDFCAFPSYALYPVTSEREKIHFHQLNGKTGNRIQYKKVDSDTGREVDKDDIIRATRRVKANTFQLSRKSWRPLRSRANDRD
jgi:non-homologous end joining protein Ku